MFSGIVEEQAEIIAVDEDKSTHITVRCSLDHSDTRIGDSIAVNGVCLTVTSIKESCLTFDLLSETIRRTNLGDFKVGDTVNLERSLKVGERVSGHFVFGHVDGVGTLKAREKDGSNERFIFTVSSEIIKFMAEKGSISINGVSLTLGSITDTTISVYLIPHTLSLTNFAKLQPDARVNIEVDMLARYVFSQINSQKLETTKRPGVTADFLREHGFMVDPA